MHEENTNTMAALRGLRSSSASVRLRAALAVGTAPDPRYVDRLIEQCAIEPEFPVRDMLTWALTRHSAQSTVPRLIEELRSDRAQARSQALHTLSKIGDRRAWPALTHAHLTDADDEVARSAWRAAVVLVPEAERPRLAEVLAGQLGRGGRETQVSLSRALIALGEVAGPVLRAAKTCGDARVRQHAVATERLLRDPDAVFDFAIEEAKRIVALGPTRQEE
ncbi:HEAT repeat domain-containing protein [Streptomyces sp. TRM68416]|uniref:HEAT repeat domain-containing protein n=1 Tax=Streptomyces sp. TRM68416 TaxID=2758412 RepID=UPI001661FE7D|nr:HEAT repeat domain-containing protein [Streptomyces sp. TRM68416]MBD0839426.1 HEAT repeat domain-containing protein [Streptomyces sp. TRM68416]